MVNSVEIGGSDTKPDSPIYLTFSDPNFKFGGNLYLGLKKSKIGYPNDKILGLLKFNEYVIYMSVMSYLYSYFATI